MCFLRFGQRWLVRDDEASLVSSASDHEIGHSSENVRAPFGIIVDDIYSATGIADDSNTFISISFTICDVNDAPIAGRDHIATCIGACSAYAVHDSTSPSSLKKKMR